MILVVDDNQYAAKALGNFLEKDGYSVALAYDGESALAITQHAEPEAVILDLSLPGMDGYEVARTLRHERQSPVLLIALTGYYGQSEDRLRGQQAGFDHYLTKPVLVADIEKLIEARRHALSEAG